jgi:hypothetical protein
MTFIQMALTTLILSMLERFPTFEVLDFDLETHEKFCLISANVHPLISTLKTA